VIECTDEAGTGAHSDGDEGIATDAAAIPGLARNDGDAVRDGSGDTGRDEDEDEEP